jgi:hypothetical protein
MQLEALYLMIHFHAAMLAHLAAVLEAAVNNRSLLMP